MSEINPQPLPPWTTTQNIEMWTFETFDDPWTKSFNRNIKFKLQSCFQTFYERSFCQRAHCSRFSGTKCCVLTTISNADIGCTVKYVVQNFQTQKFKMFNYKSFVKSICGKFANFTFQIFPTSIRSIWSTNSKWKPHSKLWLSLRSKLKLSRNFHHQNF